MHGRAIPIRRGTTGNLPPAARAYTTPRCFARPAALVWIAVLLALAAAQADDRPASADPWIGATRAEVEALLGAPDRVKTDRRGAVLVYRLLQVDEEAGVAGGVRLIAVPGVGLLGRRVEIEAQAARGETAIEPREVDEEGRPVRGGLTETYGGSSTWNKETGRFEGDWGAAADDGVRGKATLRFTIDADGGRVVDWSVRPRSLRGNERADHE